MEAPRVDNEFLLAIVPSEVRRLGSGFFYDERCCEAISFVFDSIIQGDMEDKFFYRGNLLGDVFKIIPTPTEPEWLYSTRENCQNFPYPFSECKKGIIVNDPKGIDVKQFLKVATQKDFFNVFKQFCCSMKEIRLNGGRVPKNIDLDKLIIIPKLLALSYIRSEQFFYSDTILMIKEFNPDTTVENENDVINDFIIKCLDCCNKDISDYLESFLIENGKVSSLQDYYDKYGNVIIDISGAYVDDDFLPEPLGDKDEYIDMMINGSEISVRLEVFDIDYILKYFCAKAEENQLLIDERIDQRVVGFVNANLPNNSLMCKKYISDAISNSLDDLHKCMRLPEQDELEKQIVARLEKYGFPLRSDEMRDRMI